ncbi:ribosome-recycling factor, mitochondrial-like isoform X1 [Homalodisca vitripennis]|uniref:ribosome-recycling factor, mitochondrial-like isoform X1 n=2 Tax=Homalodisca vitripennis TaxID=197043 RepID=UPI001EEB79ED|nr:ribosome-recycling factor, mitochondrial-like isoform X1 [Homalodisca vitripennis]XP_046664185.1 ribosome-recycling factor, mitochondrial-like isoform X1 [Homalodisca vitripennis]XP_046664193.1 ribosome-recycling factor, mitochondrial-like isoform X1 [Homalodisca vitripennis]XP_046664201.1 ribosome-recycling factor, mitochondrial-like isoform X1 [Homalodisca vitripennis]XP_046664210.1 ribosome-recycling factor, mitochondrial-like isoform X1 [Homalodisca vitripennis]
MALRLILSNRLQSFTSKRMYQPFLHMRSLVKCNTSLYQSDVWMSYSTFQHYWDGSYKLVNSNTLTGNQSVRHYAKSRDKKKSDKGHKKKVQINEELLAEVINVSAMQEQMLGAIEKLKNDFVKNLSLRSTSGSIETLPITFEGKEYILQDLAQVVRKNPKTVVINMAAFPQAIPTVVQAISKSGMNLNPQQDGTSLFIPIPKVTKEHRESLSKNAKALFIKCRDGIKDSQNKFIKAVKIKEKDGLSQDTANEITNYITQVATDHISTAEKMLEAKQQELLNEA